jgi:hypothetical protein
MAAAARHMMLALGFLLFPAPLFAIITISLQGVPGGRPVNGGLLGLYSMDFGTVSAFEPLPPNVNRVVGGSAYILDTDFGVRVTKLLSGSTSYTLQARLQNAHPLTWRVDGVTLSTTAATVATLQPYAATIPHTLAFVVPFARPAGNVTTTIEVIAIAD